MLSNPRFNEVQHFYFQNIPQRATSEALSRNFRGTGLTQAGRRVDKNLCGGTGKQRNDQRRLVDFQYPVVTLLLLLLEEEEKRVGGRLKRRCDTEGFTPQDHHPNRG